MLGRLVAAVAGRAVARQFGGVRAGPLGAAAGAALPFVLRRFGPLGMIGAAIGGYAVKRYLDSVERAGAADTAPAATPAAVPGAGELPS